MALSWRWSPIGTTASAPCALNCCREGRRREGKGGQLRRGTSRGGFQDSSAFSIVRIFPCQESSRFCFLRRLKALGRLLAREGINAEQLTRGLMSFELKGTGCRRAFADTRRSPNGSCTRGIAACISRAHDNNHCQDSKAAVRGFASKDVFLPVVEIKEILVEDQATQCVAFHRWTQEQSAMHNLQNNANDRYFKRCIHHIHAVLPLPRRIAIDKQPMGGQSEKLLVSKRGVKTDLGGNKDGDNSSLMTKTIGFDEFYLQKPVMHLLNGYWFGPDFEDGWGFVEAWVSPVEMGEPFWSLDC